MKHRFLVALGALALGTLSSQHAEAQTAPGEMKGYAASVFNPSERGSDWFANESNDYRGKFRLAVGVVGDYSYRGLIGAYNRDGTVRASVLRNQMLLHTGGSLVIADRLRLSLSVPIQLYADGHAFTAQDDGLVYKGPLHEQSVGDIRASADIRVLGEYGDAFNAAIGASVFIPLGQRESFTGDDVTRFAPHLNLAGDIGNFAWSARGGYELRPLRVNYIDTRLGSTVTFGGAVGVRFLDKKILVGPEIYGQTIVSNADGLNSHDTPIEALLGAHFNVANGFRINAGAGTFLDHGYGAASGRALLGLEWFPDADKPDRDKDGVPDETDACPDVFGVPTGDPRTNGCPPPPPDRDGDGVPDPVDACVDVPGVATNDPKTNGCPPDRDGDGVYDTVDACIDVPGVKTDDPKTNGCPPDRDGDGVYDKDDACPDVKGLKTDDPKTNGCPDTDRDKDGILNDDDACPDAAGPKSSDPKINGCPRVFIKNAQIQILEQPKFDFNKSTIKPDSDSLLTEVAKVMTDHPEIKHVRVEGHTDSVGAADYNKKLSQQRADAVVKWLTAHGVAADRLAAQGIGKERPLVANDTEANRALNRRVEFHIEDQETTTKEVVKTPEGKTLQVAPKDAQPKGTQPKDAQPAPKP
ncbi:MAG: Outer rane lipoprotein omp16 precursor [Labilithrix sp.]|nr:Outer rane lipoprotein omp16 precursor [Labilithrix sp.]